MAVAKTIASKNIKHLEKNLLCVDEYLSIDAMETQAKIAKTIIDKNADYVLVLKGNQSNLNDQVIVFFEYAGKNDVEELLYLLF